MDNVDTTCASLPTLSPTEVTLTVNQRLNIVLRRQCAPIETNIWPSRVILPLTTWLQQLWEQYAEQGILLSSWQEFNLWQQIITQDSDTVIINTVKTVQLAQQAWQLLNTWQIDCDSLDAMANTDIATFKLWAQQFNALCQQKQWVSESEIMPQVTQLIQSRQISTLPELIMLVGFDEITPALDSLIKALATQTKVQLKEEKKHQALIQTTSFTTAEDELQTIIQWGVQQQQDSNTSIGIVLPDLAQRRHHIRRALQSIPSHLYNISAGTPLSEYEIIQAAFNGLNLYRSQIDMTKAYQWLQSPYLVTEDIDSDMGAQLDAQLRQQQSTTLSKTDLYQALTHLNSIHSTSWLSRLHQLDTQLQHLPSTQLPSAWCQQWCQWLQILGWPGSRTLSSTEYQLVERFNAALDEFATLDQVLVPLSISQALSRFELQCKNTIFQPEGSQAPIQILGVLESAGLHFDKLWITGVDNENWPKATKPNPLIPISLQRKLNMPHSSAIRELNYNRIILDRLLTAAETVTLSWAQQKDNKQVQSSSLIKELKYIPANEWENENDSSKLKQLIDNNTLLEYIADNNAPAISATNTIRGGSRLIQLQANCAFWAFSEIRLQATPLPRPITGLGALARGKLVHHVLELIWNQLQDQQRLLAMPIPALKQLIKDAIIQSTRQLNIYPTQPEKYFYLQLEQQRLQTLLLEWLQLEKSRSDFTVLGHEIEQTITINNLKLQIKIDRIDQVASGDKIIIDYKTGSTSIAGWFGTRPETPQLPLYCSFETPYSDINGIVFAEVKAQQVAFKGITSVKTETGIAGNKTVPEAKIDAHNWQQLLGEWQDSFKTLSNEFCNGKANVNPLSPRTCQYCHYKSLCRIST